MSSFGHMDYLLYCLLCFLFCFPMVFSQLSSTQRTSMITLSGFLNSSVSWDISKEPNPCSWKGVKCDQNNSSVLEISLSGFSLASSDFLPLVCEIDSLQVFDVSNNYLSKIPQNFMAGCGKLDGLKLLNFSRNRLVGSLPQFDGFVGLEFLDLSYNWFSGSIDLELKGLIGLKSLNLSFNNFNGSVPTQLGTSKVLKEIALSGNGFQGKLPEEIMDYLNLTLIDLSQNHLSGSIPNRIGELSKLEVLVLSLNNLNGAIPESLSNIRTLSRFAANQNGFTGPIPSGITKFLRNLDLSYNDLNGSIPSDLLSPSNLQTVDLTENLLEGSIPTNISPSLVRLRLGSNSLDGQIPSAKYSTFQNLTYLELDNNNLTGSIPLELGSCKSLALLNLAQNHLTGALPVQLGNLSSLQVLKLQFNRLSGEIPNEISELEKLSVLNISWNSLSGQIPSSISSLKSLININIQGNKINGSIPITISSLNTLLELQLGENQLSGHIPNMPPNLQIALNLSSNLFEGPIPTTLAGLTGLEVLDLSNNNFSGEVPTFLTHLGSLIWLLLSNNSLSGVVPKFGSWVIVDIAGNKDLINATKPAVSSASENGNSVAIIVIASTIPVIAVGAGTIIAIFLIQRYDRKSLSQVNFLTEDKIHKSNINFTNKAIKLVEIVLKTRFSTYYKAIMPSGSSYFVKLLNGSDGMFQWSSHDRFCYELEVLGKLSNANVMIPLAYVLTVGKAYLFYEFSPIGTLFDVLHKSSRSHMDWGSRYSIAVGVAKGLAFLHGIASGPILLLDLSSRNIFLKSLKEPLVGDIELNKVIDPSKSTGNLPVAGSVGYIPPEYAYTMRITMASNVYSFGVILLELVTRKPAVTGSTELVKWVLCKSLKQEQDSWDQILDSAINRTSITVINQMLEVLKIALRCVNESPKQRPTMNKVLEMLTNVR